MPLAPEWQQPYINVFKLCDLDTLKEFERKGDITEHMDRIIGKKVFKVRGIIPAGNFVRIPRSPNQTLGCTGRFLYLQLKASPVKVFVIHVEVVTADGNVHRISVSNMYSPEALKRKSNGVQIPYPRASHRWSILALDLTTSVAKLTSSPFASLKSIQFCSWLTIRGGFTSDFKYSLRDLPSELALSHALDSSTFDWLWLPLEPVHAPTQDSMPPPKRIFTKVRVSGADQGPAYTKFGGLPLELDSSDEEDLKREDKELREREREEARERGEDVGSGLHHQGSFHGSRAPSVRSMSDAGSRRTAGSRHTTATSARARARAKAEAKAAAKKPPPNTPLESVVDKELARLGIKEDIYKSLGLGVPPGAADATAQRTNIPTNTAPGAAAAAVATRAAVAPRTAAAAGMAKTETGAPMPLERQSASSAAAAVAATAGAIAATVRYSPLPDSRYPPLQPDPALRLERINCYSGEMVRCGLWAPASEEVVFAAACSVVAMHSVTHAQRFFFGHSAHVACLSFDASGQLLASGQDGKEPLIRLWDFASGQCLAILCGHASSLTCLDISPDCRCLAGVGLDAHAKQTIVLWNITKLRSEGTCEVVTRHTTEFNIKVLKFSAYQEDHLVTAGRDSVRMYRLKAGQLRGTSVRMAAPERRVTSYAGGLSAVLGPNIFTDIAFEAGVGVFGVDAWKVYVSSASGAVFQVDYHTRTLTCVYQLHSGPINCLQVLDGLCVTGSDDRLLRVWPLDFRDYLLEAEHEGGVTALGVSPDGLRVAIGTECGTLGVLAVPTHKYTTLLRSHCGAVNCVAADPARRQYCTVSTDGTMRVWDLDTHQQVYEFDAPGEMVTAACYHPRHHELAVGFESGRLRVFDVDATTLVQEQQQHRGPVSELVYSPDGSRLYSGGQDGALVVYDVLQVYCPIKYLSAGVRDVKMCVAASPDGAYVAALSRDPYRGCASLLLFHASSLEPFMRIETDAPAYARLAFSPTLPELWAVSAGRRLDRYELGTGQLLDQVFEAHRQSINVLAPDPSGRYLATAGDDGQLRLWGVVPFKQLQPGKGAPPAQAFTGHPSSVLAGAWAGGGSHLVTAGDSDCVYIWKMLAPPPPPPPAPATPAPPASLSLPTQALPLPPPPPSPGRPQQRAGDEMPARMAALGASPGKALHVAGRTSAPSSPAPSKAKAKASRQGGSSKPSPAKAQGQAQVHETDATLLSPPSHEGEGEGLHGCLSLVGYTPKSAAGYCPSAAWLPAKGLLAYIADNVVVVEALGGRSQSYLTATRGDLSCLAVCPSGSRIAAACAAPEPSASGASGLAAGASSATVGGFADVVVWDVASGAVLHTLRYHPLGVKALAFSLDGRWLVSIGKEPERSLVLWEVDSGALVAAGRTERAMHAVQWLACSGGAAAAAEAGVGAQLMTAGADGLLLWTLQDSYLEQRSVPMPSSDGGHPAGGLHDLPTEVSALALDPAGVLLAADVNGSVWHVVLSPDGSAAMAQVACMAGCAITALAANTQAALVATAEGVVVRFSRTTAGGTWGEEGRVALDGRVCALAPEPSSLTEAVVATSTSTIWYVGLHDGSRVPLVCAAGGGVAGLSACPHDPSIVACCSDDGVLRLWRLAKGEAEPSVEVASPAGCTAATFVPTQQHVLGGYADGSVRLLAVQPSVEVVWASTRHPAPVVSLVAHPRKPWAISAALDGSIAVTDMTSTRLLAYITEFVTGGIATAPGATAPAGPGRGGPMHGLAVSGGPAASLAAAAWPRGFVVFPTPWEDPTCRIMAQYECEETPGALSTDVPACITFVPNATKLLAYTSPLLLGRVLLYDYRLAQVTRSLAVPQMVASMAWSPDGAHVALGCMAHALYVLHAGTGRALQLRGHTAPVTACSFTAGGKLLVSSARASVMVWDAEAAEDVIKPPPAAKILMQALPGEGS